MPPTPPPYFAFSTNIKYFRFLRFFLTFVLYFLLLFFLSGPVAFQGAWEAAGRRNVDAWDRDQGSPSPFPRLHWSRGLAQDFSRSAWGEGVVGGRGTCPGGLSDSHMAKDPCGIQSGSRHLFRESDHCGAQRPSAGRMSSSTSVLLRGIRVGVGPGTGLKSYPITPLIVTPSHVRSCFLLLPGRRGETSDWPLPSCFGPKLPSIDVSPLFQLNISLPSKIKPPQKTRTNLINP